MTIGKWAWALSAALGAAACGTGEIATATDTTLATTTTGAGGANGGGGATSAGGAATTTSTSGSGGAATSTSAGGGSTSTSTSTSGTTSTSSGSGGAGGAPPPACTTRITYGSAWMHPANHPDDHDDVDGLVDWDGTCVDDGPNSYAVLSNGWKPYFSGHSACVVAIDRGPGCPGANDACSTRIAYGPAWMPAPNHPASYDDVGSAVLWDGACPADGGNSYASLSNGWNPHFTGHGACQLSFRYTQCGGLYANPVVPVDCPDPGVLRAGNEWVMACTSGGAPAFPIRTSPDLVTWSDAGHIFPNGKTPAWASGDYWAPEIHKVGGQYVAYFTARVAGSQLSIGAATAPSPTGPFTDIGHPLVASPSMGFIDATEFEASDGTKYLVWKEDGNAVSKATPIYGQRLAHDGLSLVGQRVTLITNDRAWEGPLVEGPWVVERGGEFFLFYSGNFYASASYALGVARASSPLGPYTKAGGPIVTSSGPWAGPGHGSVVAEPGGTTYFVYHAWEAGHVGNAPGRLVLVDRVDWDGNGWPFVPAGPSARSLPRP